MYPCALLGKKQLTRDNSLSNMHFRAFYWSMVSCLFRLPSAEKITRSIALGSFFSKYSWYAAQLLLLVLLLAPPLEVLASFLRLGAVPLLGSKLLDLP